MKTIVQIQWTCASADEARSIISTLIKEKKVACANIIPQVESHFFWEGKLETAQEVKVILKTTEERFSEVEAYIKQHCSYDEPEILKFIVDGGSSSYLKWVAQEVSH